MLDTFYVRTRQGEVAVADQTVPMSGGFRRLLILLNGKTGGAALLTAMPQLDEMDLQLWLTELLNMGLIAVKGHVADDDAAFTMSTSIEMPNLSHPMSPAHTERLIESVMTTVASKMAPPLSAAIEKKLSRTTRLAAIESVSSFAAMGKSRFFVYPDVSHRLPTTPRVCLATHDKTQAKLLTLLVKSAVGVAEVAASREELLAALRGAAPPHILFLDAELPGIDGFRVLESIRTKPTLKSMRVVLVAMRGERVDLAQAMLLGAAGYIVKPLTKQVMAMAIPQIFGKSAH